MYILARGGSDEGIFDTGTEQTILLTCQAGEYDEKYLKQAVSMFKNMLSFGNHLRIFSEEISASGEQLGNTPQAFAQLSLISAAYNLDKSLGGKR